MSELVQEFGRFLTRKMRYDQEILQATVVNDNGDGTYDVLLKGNSGTMKRVPYIGQGTIRVNDTIMLGNYDGDRQRPQIIQGAGAQSSPLPLEFDLAPNNNWQNSGATNGNYVSQVVVPNQPIQAQSQKFSNGNATLTLPVNPSFSNYVIEAAVGQTVFLRSQFWEIIQAFNLQDGTHLFDITPPNGLQDAWFDQTGIYLTTLNTGTQVITIQKYSISKGTLLYTSANKYSGTVTSGNNIYNYAPVVASPNNFKSYVIDTNLLVYFETTTKLVVNVLNAGNNPGTYSTVNILVANLLAVDTTTGKGTLFQQELAYGSNEIDLWTAFQTTGPPGRNPIGFIQFAMVFVPDNWLLAGMGPVACATSFSGYQMASYSTIGGLGSPFGTASITNYNTTTTPDTVRTFYNLTPVVSHVFYSFQNFPSSSFPSNVGLTDLDCPKNPPTYVGATGTFQPVSAQPIGHFDLYMITANATTGITMKKIYSFTPSAPALGFTGFGSTVESAKNKRVIMFRWNDINNASWIAGGIFDGVAGTFTLIMPQTAYNNNVHFYLNGAMGVCVDNAWVSILGHT